MLRFGDDEFHTFHPVLLAVKNTTSRIPRYSLLAFSSSLLCSPIDFAR